MGVSENGERDAGTTGTADRAICVSAAGRASAAAISDEETAL
jgi:hypothetical protein